MRILLDECLPRNLGRELIGHEVRTVPQMGWDTIKNGRLLALAEERFDLFLTNDSEIEFQQNVSRFNIAIVALRLGSNRLKDILPYVPKILTTLSIAAKGRVCYVDAH